MSDDCVQYGGFWKRLGAILLDFVFMVPLLAISWFGAAHFRRFELYWFVFGQLFGLVWSVYLVKRYGGTPGKLVMNLTIRKVNLEPVGYREAFLRYLPEAALNFAVGLGTAYAVTHITDAEYFSLSMMQRAKRLAELAPAWRSPVLIANNVWFWGELLVLLTNKKRRALHDFIAGTVVVVKQTEIVPQTVAAPQSVA